MQSACCKVPTNIMRGPLGDASSRTCGATSGSSAEQAWATRSVGTAQVGLVARRARLAPRSHIIVRLAIQGTNLCDYGGIPATGKKVDFRHVTVCRLQSGLIVEQWGLSDNLSLLTRLGLVDAPRIG
jgi:hypothetical protein